MKLVYASVQKENSDETRGERRGEEGRSVTVVFSMSLTSRG